MRSFSPFLVKIKTALGAGLLLLALVCMASLWAIDSLIDAAQARGKAEESLVLVERAATSIKAAESTVRQYLLSGSAADLQEIARVSTTLRESLGHLRKAAVLPEQETLDGILLERRVMSEQAIAARQASGTEAAAAVVNSALSKDLRRRTDAIFETARERQYKEWQISQNVASSSANWARVFILATGLLFAGLLWWTIYVVNHYEGARRRIEAQLRDSEAISRSITEGMAESVITTTSDDKVFEVNAAALTLFGYEKKDLIGRDVSMLVPERLRSRYKDTTRQFRQEGADFRVVNREMRTLRKDGTEFTASVSFGNVKVGEQQLFTALIHDITESRRMTQALRASESQLRQITDAVPALIAYVDLEQRFSFHNQAYETTLGLPFDQIRHQTMTDVLGPQVYATVQGWVNAALSGQTVHYEREHVTPLGERKSFAMQYFPRYGEGSHSARVIGFFSLGTDITEIKRIDQMKTEFISTVSHELRTPLTSIRGSLGLIAGGVAGDLPEKLKNLVGIAKSNCERLIRLINDMLDSEKIESGKIRLDLQRMDLHELAAQALSGMSGFAEQHRVALNLEQPAAQPDSLVTQVVNSDAHGLYARVDADRILQVLTNLLSNAVKFSPAGSAVLLTVKAATRAGAPRVRVEVVDHGKGIDNEFKSRIFHKFSQADSSDTRQKGGTGLGLNISRALIEKMDGTLGFESQPGYGSTFYFELPRCLLPDLQEQPLPLLPGSTTAAPALPQVVPQPRILVCEGDPDVARLIAILLDKAGFASDLAYTEAQAQAWLLEGTPYDAITLDLKLPGASGAGFISMLRSYPQTLKVPVVVIAASSAEGQLLFNHKPALVSDWLEKPIDERRLAGSLRRAINGLQRNSRPRVLHVEDDLDIQQITAEIAHDVADFECASTLAEAVRLLQTRHFDLVLLDLTLGRDSGWSLFGTIDTLEPPPPVIVFSASEVEHENSRPVRALLVKADTSNSELLHTIERVLQQSR